MLDPVSEQPGAAPALPRGRRPSPRIAQLKRTWYFLRRNTLAMVGLGIIVFLVLVALYAATTSLPWDHMIGYCSYTPNSGTTCGPGVPSVCVYPVGTASPGPNCYQVPSVFGVIYPSFIAPTVNPHTLAGGPLPRGSFQTDIQNPGSNSF